MLCCVLLWFVNSLAPGKSGFNFKSVIFHLVLLIGIFRSYDDNALRWMSRDLSEDKSTLVQVRAWCGHQQAITWANVDPDLCRHMASLGHNELTHRPLGGVNENFIRKAILTLTLVTDGWNISCEIVPRWMSVDLTDDKSTMVQAMACCWQAASHYLNQCWLTYMLHTASLGHIQLMVEYTHILHGNFAGTRYQSYEQNVMELNI